MAVDTALAGGTGLTGSYILSTLIDHPAVKSIYALGRREFTSSSNKLHPLVDADASHWPSLLTPRLQNASGSFIFFSALGTTRAKVGGLANQYKVDHELPVSLAKTFASLAPVAGGDGRAVFLLISSSGANPKSFFGYPKMKGETEEEVKALIKGQRTIGSGQGYDHVVILRPGLICGDRQVPHGIAELALRKIAHFAGPYLGNAFKDFWAQDAEVIARAAVNAALQCAEGQRKEPVWLLGQSDIVRLGRTEWNKRE